MQIQLLKMFSSFRATNELKFNLWLNYLLVSYAFVVPINDRACSFLFSLILLLIVFRGQFKTYFSSVVKNPVVIALMAFFGIYVLSLLWSENIKEGIALVKSVKYALFLPLFLSFIDKRFSLRIISAFLGGMLLSELISYGIHFEILPTQLVWQGIQIYSSYAIHDPSPFLHHSHYGMALALSVSILIYRVFEPVAISYKVIASIFIMTMTMNLLITGGRIGYLLYAVLILLSLFLSLEKKMFKPAVAIVLLIGLVGIGGYKLSSIFQKRVDETICNIQAPKNFDSSAGNRLGLWYHSAGVITNNPLFGVGIGDGLDETRKRIPAEENFLKDMTHFHNQYIEILVGTGVVGLLIFLNIFAQIYKYEQKDKELKAIMLLVSVAIAFALLTETFNMKFYFSLWIVLLAAAMAKGSSPESDSLKVFSELKIYTGLILLALIVGKLQ